MIDSSIDRGKIGVLDTNSRFLKGQIRHKHPDLQPRDKVLLSDCVKTLVNIAVLRNLTRGFNKADLDVIAFRSQKFSLRASQNWVNLTEISLKFQGPLQTPFLI